MTSKLLNFIFLTFFTLFVIWAVGWLWFVTTIALTKPNTTITKTDAIIVLTGGNGRIDEGLSLLTKKVAPKLFISGVNKDVTKQDILETSNIDANSVPCCISLGYKSTDTISNAAEIKEWVNENGTTSFRLITSSYHMPRAAMEIEKQLPDTNIILHPVFSHKVKSWEGKFWKLTFGEYNKTILRWMKTRTSMQNSNTQS